MIGIFYGTGKIFHAYNDTKADHAANWIHAGSKERNPINLSPYVPKPL